MDILKILHTADWHLGKSLNGYSMIDDQEYVLKRLIRIIEEEQIDVVCLSGDVYDKAIASIEAISLFDYFLQEMVRLGKKVVIISGNHDQNIRLSQYSALLSSKNLFFAKPFAGQIEKVVIDDCHFYLLPYTSLFMFKQITGQDYKNSSEAYQEFISKLEIDKSKCNILLAHDYVAYMASDLEHSDSERELIVGGSEYVDAKIFTSFDYVALGHMHKAQKVLEEKIRYSGSLLKYSFSEVNHKKSVVCFDTITKQIKLVDLPFINDMVIIKGSLDELLSKEFYQQYNYKTDYFKAIITDKKEVIDAHMRLIRIYPNLMEIQKESFTQDRVIKKTLETKSLKTSLAPFFKDIYEYEITEKEEKYLTKLLQNEREQKNENK